MNQDHIRNFVIIAHIDHGKSTLADRLLETTGTIESRRMRPQYLDQMDLERERGITIKMAPVRMEYHPQLPITNYQLPNGSAKSYVLNLIDTPGHSDFSYEVSRALEAVEGAVLLVDITKGIQAQTLSNLRMARKAGLKIIGAVNKVDLPGHNPQHVAEQLADLINVPVEEISLVSGKSGIGVEELLNSLVKQIPSPDQRAEAKAGDGLRALIFDSRYDDHKGILAYVRVFSGSVRPGEEIYLVQGGASLKVREVGTFSPELRSSEVIGPGEIGYIATGLKEPALVRIGDTVARHGSSAIPLPGYREATPVVFISFYPDGTTTFEDLERAFARLHLNDPALSFTPDANEALGRGIKVGFLGQLHFEIAADRLRREFNLEFMTSFPSIAYRVIERGAERVVTNTADWPVHPDKVFQPMIDLEILVPSEYMNQVLSLATVFEMEIRHIENIADGLSIQARMPLAELIRDFDDQLKSASAGYASFSYDFSGEAEAEVSKLEILIAGEVQPALSRIVSKKDVEREGRSTVERLKILLPQQQFTQALQAQVDGRIIARETIAAQKKKLGDFGKNGGDRTRKMKLWKKQKEGKERLKETGRVNVPIEVFREVLKK